MRPLLLTLALALALTGCGRKGYPERPPWGERPDPATTIPLKIGGEDAPQEDDPLLQPRGDPATPGPRLEEEVDDRLDG